MVNPILLILAVYILYGLFLYMFQSNFIYFPDKQDFNECSGFSDAEKVNVNGTRLYYKHNTDKLLVFYHGNAGSACDRSYVKDQFEKMNYSYIFVEYAGYSNDARKPSKELILQDVENTISFIKKKKFSEIVLAGESIGTGPVSYHASLTKPDKIVLMAPFTRMSDVARKHYAIYPIKLLLRNEYDNERWLQSTSSNILIIHGSKDNVVPIKLSKKLSQSVKNAKHITIDGAGHNDLYDYEEMWKSIHNFLNDT